MGSEETTSEPALVSHYSHGGDVAATIAEALGTRPDGAPDPTTLDPELLAGAEEFHLGGRMAIAAMADNLDLGPDDRVLDVGCGIGGTARTLARRFGCHVDGVDLTPSFVAAATTLSRRTGLEASTKFRVGDATALPYDDAVFDLVTVVHVGMNVADKAALAGEVARVLMPRGRVVVYDIMQVRPSELDFPMPWSPTPEHSHLDSPEAYRGALRDAGLQVTSTTDRSALVRRALAAAAETPPPVHLGHLMGEDFPTMFANLRRELDAGTLAPVEIRARRDHPGADR